MSHFINSYKCQIFTKILISLKKYSQNENNDAEIYGYIRGNTLIPGKYIHITGFGDYKNRIFYLVSFHY